MRLGCEMKLNILTLEHDEQVLYRYQYQRTTSYERDHESLESRRQGFLQKERRQLGRQ